MVGYWLVALVAAGIILWAFIVKLMLQPMETIGLAYAGGIVFGGALKRGRGHLFCVQWDGPLREESPCPITVHLPGGDLGGAALCAIDGAIAAEKFGASAYLDIFPFLRDGTVGGVRVGLLPGCPPVALTIAAKRLTMPVSEEEVIHLFGVPLQRVIHRNGRVAC